MNLSPHFTLEELTYSSTAARHGIDNTPSAEVVTELIRLCLTVLETARLLLQEPFHTDSGYRCLAVNTLVKGSKNSQHMLGQAADVIPDKLNLQAAFDKVRLSAVPYDQLILECGSWLHMSCSADNVGPRRMALIGSLVNGLWVYQRVNP